MRKSKNLFIIIVGVILVILLSLVLFMRDNSIIINKTDFNNLLKSDSKLFLDDKYIYIKDNNKTYKIAKDLVDLSSLDNAVVEVKDNNILDSILNEIGILVVVLLGMAVLSNMLFRTFKKDSKPILESSKTQQEFQSQLSSNTQNSIVQNISVTFDDIAGIKEVKDELLEIIDYLKNPLKYQSNGIHLPKGILLVGPPGVGKTMIAKAIANEAKVPFFYQSGSSFAQIYVGVGAKRVRELFYQAKLNAPSIVFIDEIDAVGKSRGGNRNDEREATLNQLLTEMDGFLDNSGVIVLGATNRVEILDPALLRSGRFDRRVHIDLPDVSERKKIIELYLRNKKCNVNVDEIARQSVGFSGASIASLVNEASLNALRRGSNVITNDDFFVSASKISSGVKKQLSFSDDEKNILSLYQAAKAVCAYWCEIDFDKISLIGEGIKNSDKNFLSKTDLLNRIKVALSGNVFLEMKVGETYTNAKDDIRIAKELASEMCETYAMGDRIIVDASDVLAILDNIKEDLKIFFKSASSAIFLVQKELLQNEKITRAKLGEIFSKEMFN